MEDSHDGSGKIGRSRRILAAQVFMSRPSEGGGGSSPIGLNVSSIGTLFTNDAA
jgi:hypothetical protein